MERDKIAYELYRDYNRKKGERIVLTYESFILNNPAYKQHYDIVDKIIRKRKLEKINSL